LLSVQNAAARLTDHTLSQPTVVVDLAAKVLERQVVFAVYPSSTLQCLTRTFYDLLGNADELIAVMATLNGIIVQIIMASRVLYGLAQQRELVVDPGIEFKTVERDSLSTYGNFSA
jgi:hypothetical protein